jgi:hypothetical protein
MAEKREAASVWHQGKATISILQRHIDDAMARNSSHCATAEAIREQVREARFISVDLQTIRWTDAIKKVRYVFLTPHAIQGGVIVPFDQGERENCKPVTVRMRPCTVIKIGKKRCHTPDPEQLRSLGLRVAAEQPHIGCHDKCHDKSEPPPTSPESRLESASEAEKELVRNWKREPDPWAHDRAMAPAPRRKPRQPRAKVSAATKGSIPVTLGGRLPPTSVLSRREYGLRALKR